MTSQENHNDSSAKKVGQINNRTMTVEIENEETGEIRPARLTDTGVLFDEVGIFTEEWSVVNPVGYNLKEKI